jgi:hypothetical protein
MADHRKMIGLLMAVLLACVIAGCATSGTEKELTAGDAAMLSGVWQGRVYPPGGSMMQPATLTIKPDLLFGRQERDQGWRRAVLQHLGERRPRTR